MKKEKTVSFNLNDPREKRLYEYACSVNFSGLVKSLLFHYLQNEGVFGHAPTRQVLENESEKEENVDNLDDIGLPYSG